MYIIIFFFSTNKTRVFPTSVLVIFLKNIDLVLVKRFNKFK